jgi:hypothetical protein
MAITRKPKITAKDFVTNFERYLEFLKTDTTAANLYGPWIDNRDGRALNAYFNAIVTDKAGTSPTAQLKLQGCLKDPNTETLAAADVFDLIDTSGNAVTSGSAQSISGADSTSVGVSLDCINKRSNFPPFFRCMFVIGGTSTPGATCRIDGAVVRRDKYMVR